MSVFFLWDKPKLSVGVSLMDREHEKLISIMNKLFERNESGAPKQELLSIAKDLASFTVAHFSNEEKYMESVVFKSLDVHKHIHKDLLSKFTKHLEAFEKGPDKLPAEFFAFLKVWLSAHIQGIDKQYSPAAKKAA